jgi:EAL domain-containing protein (putative c-di-GMP-specific phosphodiesterase class I)
MLADNDADARILVVDDSVANVTLLCRLLEKSGMGHVEGVTDSSTVIDLVKTFDPDIVLLDLHMPEPDGYRLLQEIGDLVGDGYLPVVIITADVDQQAKERALHAGAADFLTKPYPATETLLRVRNLIRTRRLHQVVQDRATALTHELEVHKVEERERAASADQIAALLDDIAGNLTMVFQPIVSLELGETVGYEALARFQLEPQRPPNEWFLAAFAADLGPELERAAIEAALDELDGLPRDVSLSVNVSPRTLLTAATTELIDRRSDRMIVVELTEHEPVTDYGPINDAMDGLRAGGARLAVDDAGAGFAGLHHILRLRPELIKLDRLLVTGIDNDPARRSLAAALMTFAGETGAQLIAEGIETEAELATLTDLGVHYGQGYHLGRPGPLPTADT